MISFRSIIGSVSTRVNSFSSFVGVEKVKKHKKGNEKYLEVDTGIKTN
jgi:hypothetical protein